MKDMTKSSSFKPRQAPRVGGALGTAAGVVIGGIALVYLLPIVQKKMGK